MDKTRRPKLKAVVAALEKMHGALRPPPPASVFEFVLWENAGYIVDDARRLEVFLALKKEIGLTPEKILAASPAKLVEAVHSGGMLPAMRAEKLRSASRIAVEVGLAALDRLMRADPKAARKILKRFPGIAEPGADKLMMMFAGHAGLAPESNALRVLNRLGFGKEDQNYGRSYRSAEEAAKPELPADPKWRIRAHWLLRRHGQEICRRTKPACEICPLAGHCLDYSSRVAKSSGARA